MSAPPEARVLARSEHDISRANIDPDALKVLYRLHRNGHLGYLVGGAVRDLLLGKSPKDYDIATDATPEEILDLFRNSRIIGRRFPIVHVMFGRNKVLEVATFRAYDEDEEEASVLPSDMDSREEEERLEEQADELVDGNGDEPEPVRPPPVPRRRRGRMRDRGRHLLEFSDQPYGTPGEDALRRDLTINGMFYNIGDFTVIDYVGGLADLEAGVVRIIGDPDQRILADPVRMIRVTRHAARAGFRIDEGAWNAILRHGPLLAQCSKARVLEEFYRDLRGGSALPCLRLMREAGLLGVLLPELEGFLPADPDADTLAWRRLELLDEAVASGETFTHAFLLALLFAFPLSESLSRAEAAAGHRLDYGRHAYRFLKPLTAQLGVARRDNERLFLIAISQRRLARCREGQPVPGFFRDKPYFEEAYRLFRLDAEASGAELPPLEFGGRTRRSRRRRRRRPRRDK